MLVVLLVDLWLVVICLFWFFGVVFGTLLFANFDSTDCIDLVLFLMYWVLVGVDVLCVWCLL